MPAFMAKRIKFISHGINGRPRHDAHIIRHIRTVGTAAALFLAAAPNGWRSCCTAL